MKINHTTYNYNNNNTNISFKSEPVDIITETFNNATKKIVERKIESSDTKLGRALNGVKTILEETNKKILGPEVVKQEDGAFIKLLGKMLKKIGNSSSFKYVAHLKGKNTISYVIATGNALKEAVGTVIYTVQALTNENLAPDKRKFVGMYDLGVGIVSTSLSFIFGIGVVPFQDKIADKIVGKKLASTPGFKAASLGIAFMIPTVLQQILIKRVVAPAVATPIAGDLKKRMEEAEAAKKGKKTSPPVELSPLTSPIILGKNTQPNKNSNLLDSFQRKA